MIVTPVGKDERTQIREKKGNTHTYTHIIQTQHILIGTTNEAVDYNRRKEM